jgi:dTDP-4-amino-4,6-dideoxygalactose transaminase
MKRIDDYLKRREEIWEMYNKPFSSLPVFCPAEPEKDTVHARHLYTLLIEIETINKTRDMLQQELHELKIGTGIHFISLHLHDYYRKTYGFKPNDYPNAKWISERTISLPLSAKLNDNDVWDVIRAIRYVFE